jgi:predicted RecB family endonuclease
MVEKNKLVEQLDSQLKKAIKDVDILQNINLEYQKTEVEKDNKIKSMDTEIQKLKRTILPHKSKSKVLHATHTYLQNGKTDVDRPRRVLL